MQWIDGTEIFELGREVFVISEDSSRVLLTSRAEIVGIRLHHEQTTEGPRTVVHYDVAYLDEHGRRLYASRVISHRVLSYREAYVHVRSKVEQMISRIFAEITPVKEEECPIP